MRPVALRLPVLVLGLRRALLAATLAALAACGPAEPQPVARGLLDEAPWLREWLENPADVVQRVSFREPPASEPYRSVLETGADLATRAFGREIAGRSQPFDDALWRRTCDAFARARGARRLRFGFATVGWDVVVVRKGEGVILFMKDPASTAVRVVAASDLQLEAELPADVAEALTAAWRAVPQAG